MTISRANIPSQVSKSPGRRKRRNPVAKDLGSKKYRPRVKASKKTYSRKRQEKL